MPGFGTQQAGGTLQPQTLAALNLVSSGVYPTQGNIFFVSPGLGSDNNPGTAAAPLASLSTAFAMATAGQNDIIYLLAHSNTAGLTTNYLSSVLTWNKDLVHLIGVNGGPRIGQRSRISNLAGSAAMAPMVNVTGNGCLFANLEFFQGTPGSGTTSICVQVTGQRNHFYNCQIAGMGDLTAVADVSGSRSLKISGSENLFERCTIGLTTAIRATMVEEVEISAGARNSFESCDFETYTSLSTFKMVAIATGCDRYIRFTDCNFLAVQNITSAVAPTGAIGITTMNGQVVMKNPYVYGFTQIVTADNAYVQVLGLDGTATGHLIGIAQGVDAA
jgi:hypothetical protein